MKKQNNRFRNGNNNNGYTLNYKFDSVSIAGKTSGTALDLIRRYNDLAKEAQSCGNYVEMEVYRQYAEHYRKIVTDINERRQARFDNQNRQDEGPAENAEPAETATPAVEPVAESNGYVETLPAPELATKSFQVVEVAGEQDVANEEPKSRRIIRRKPAVSRKVAEA